MAADMPTLGYIGNPMDPWGATEATPAYRSCFTAFADSGGYDVIALVHDFPFRSTKGEVELALELAGVLVAATAERPAVLPVFVSLTSGDASQEIVELADAAGGMPVLRGTQAAFAAIARLAWWEARRVGRLADGPVRPAWPSLAVDVPRYGRDPGWLEPGNIATSPEHVTTLSERESLERLRAAGIPVVEAVAAETADAAAAIAARLGWPVVVKLDAAGAAHKSDLGGVVVELGDEAAVRAAFEAVIDAGRAAGLPIHGVLVEPQAEAGVEVIVGARRDPQVGPLVVVGLGGVLAEVLDDVAIRLAPVRPADARSMIDDLRGAAILRGAAWSPAGRHRCRGRARRRSRPGHRRSSRMAGGRSQPGHRRAVGSAGRRRAARPRDGA